MTRARIVETSVGGWVLVAGALLLSASLLLIALLPDPPRAVQALGPWVESNSLELAVSNELMFFAVVCLVPAIVVLGRAIRRFSGFSRLVGCGALLIDCALLLVTIAVQGRLVYPVFGIPLGAETTALVVSLLYGMIHNVFLLLATGIVALGFALRGSGSAWLAPVSWVVGLVQAAGAFPWLTPNWVNVAIAVVLFGWTLVIGVWLVRSAGRQPSAPSQPA